MNPPRIAGLDLSTKRIGYADPAGKVWSITSAAGADAVARRLSELERFLEFTMRRHPPLPDLVAIEGYSLASPGRLALVRLGELGGVVRARLFELEVRYVEIPPTSLKRHATGNGNANKEQMEARARELGALITNHDEADAWLARRMARHAHGLEDLRLDHETDAIANAGISW
jgi:crossover junction endodeoxyribonuclease RuvC